MYKLSVSNMVVTLNGKYEKCMSGLFHLNIHGGVERSSMKKSWGEGVKIKKIIGRGVCKILKNMGRGGGGGGYLAKK